MQQQPTLSRSPLILMLLLVGTSSPIIIYSSPSCIKLVDAVEQDFTFAVSFPPSRTALAASSSYPATSTGSSLIPHPLSSSTAFIIATSDFPDSENHIFDSAWLLPPFVASLIPCLEEKSQQCTVGDMEIPVIHLAALQSRSVNCLENSDSGLDTKSGNKGFLRSGGSVSTKSRSVTPTRKPSLLAKVKPSTAPTPSNSHCRLPSTAASANPPVKASIPKEPSACLTTAVAKTSVLTSRSTSRSATPARSLATLSSASAPSRRSLSVKKSAPSRGSSPTVRSTTWKAAEVTGGSLDTPPNSKKTSVLERPVSASRIRPGAASAESALSGTKQQACSSSSSGGKARHGNSNLGCRSFKMVKSRGQCDDGDRVNPVLIGTQMVERVVNMRKLAPPKVERNCYGQTAEKSSSSLNGSGFGRTLSKTSLDMALRHMDIGKARSGSLGPEIRKYSVHLI